MMALAKLTASVILLCILLGVVFFGVIFTRHLVYDIHAYRQYKTLTCGEFLKGLSGSDAAKSASYVALFDAPGANLIVRLADADLVNYPATFKQVLHSCRRQPQFTLSQAMVSAAQVNIDRRVKQVLQEDEAASQAVSPTGTTPDNQQQTQ